MTELRRCEDAQALLPGQVMIYKGAKGVTGSVILSHRKDDGSGWWNVNGSGLADAVIEDDAGCWFVATQEAADPSS